MVPDDNLGTRNGFVRIACCLSGFMNREIPETASSARLQLWPYGLGLLTYPGVPTLDPGPGR